MKINKMVPVVLAILAVLVCFKVDNENTAIKAMNRQELQYDANDWFVMINLSDKLIGVYRGADPVEHARLKGDLSNYYTPIVVLWKEVKQSNIKTDLADDVPVLIYKG